MQETNKPRHGAGYYRVRFIVRVTFAIVVAVILLAAASWADGPLHDEPTPPECVATEDAAGPGPCVRH